MGILDNIESAWENNFQFESSSYKQEPENLAVKIFSETCCNGCTCKIEEDHERDK